MSDEQIGGRIGEVVDFWFDAAAKPYWFQRSDAFDLAVADRLGAHHAAAAGGACEAWMAQARGSLALCILLDQVPRNIFRGSPRAFATDAEARRVSAQAIAGGHDLSCTVEERVFLYLPLEHHEDADSQDRSVALFTERVGDALTVRFAERHREIIRRFGRFPHRNAILGRDSTAEEIAFLQEPNSSF